MLEKDILVLIIDFNIIHWQSSPIQNALNEWMEQLLAFCHIYQSQSEAQSLVVIAAGLEEAQVNHLYHANLNKI